MTGTQTLREWFDKAVAEDEDFAVTATEFASWNDILYDDNVGQTLAVIAGDGEVAPAPGCESMYYGADHDTDGTLSGWYVGCYIDDSMWHLATRLDWLIVPRDTPPSSLAWDITEIVVKLVAEAQARALALKATT